MQILFSWETCFFLGGRWICCGPCFSAEVSSSANMRLTPGSPQPTLTAILALTLAAFLPQLSSGGTPFPRDLEPVSIVGKECKFQIFCVTIMILVSDVVVKAKKVIICHDCGTQLREPCFSRTCLVQGILQRFILDFNSSGSVWFICCKTSHETCGLVLKQLKWNWSRVVNFRY